MAASAKPALEQFAIKNVAASTSAEVFKTAVQMFLMRIGAGLLAVSDLCDAVPAVPAATGLDRSLPAA